MFWMIPFFGQQNGDISERLKEQIILNTDRDLYLSGESIWFDAFCFADKMLATPSASQVLYLELFSHESKSLNKLKIEIVNGKASGAIRIPEETNSGNYFLSAYTHAQRNFDPGLFQINVITIIHPGKPLPPLKENEGDLYSTQIENGIEQMDTALAVEIKPLDEKLNFGRRESITYTLKIPALQNEDMANLSVAIAKKGTANSYNYLKKTVIGEGQHSLNKLSFVPEFRDVSMSGIIREKASMEPLSGIQVYISVLGDNPQFHIYKTNTKGEFLFSLYQVSGEVDVCLCTEKTGVSDLEIMINNDFVTHYPNLPEIPLDIDTTKQVLLEEMLLNYQLSRQFLKLDSTSWKAPDAPPFIFGETYITVILGDFIPLPDLETVLKELVPPVKVRKRKGDYSLAVYHADRGLMFEDPLVLVDNIVVFDINELMKIHPALIEKIEVIKETHQYGDYVLRGIISITTNTNNFGGMKLPSGYIFAEYQTLTKPTDFVFPEFDRQEEKTSPVPDFRNLLAWKPDIILKGDKASFSFYSGDHNSAYDIIVRGVSKSGKVCFGKSSFTISNR
jgi:hypothetical protein